MQTALRRAVSMALVILLGAALLVTVPMPVVVSAQTHRATVRTEHVAMRVQRGLGRGAQLAAVAAAEPAVQQALVAPARGRASATTPFDALGVTVAVPPTEPILVRGRVAGRWTPWFEAEFVPDEAPDQATEPTRPGAHSSPIWFGGADAYEVDAPASLGTLSVHLVSDQVTGTHRQVVAAQAGALGAPAIIGRAGWGARAPKVTPSWSDDLKVAIVHHSVNANTYTPAQVPALLRAIQAYHMDVQGWDDIAYNFAVDRFGRTWEARAGGIDKVVIGGHSQGFNTSTTGVVVLGDFTSVKAPPAVIEAVSRVIAWKFALHRVDPATTVPFTTPGSKKWAAGTTVTLRRILGHRDVQTTSCPGSGLYSQLGAIRSRVAQLVPQYQAGLPVRLIGVDRNGDGLQDAIEHRLGPTADTAWVSNGLGAFTRSTLPAISIPYRTATGDFDGDGRQDVVLHGSGSSPDWIWYSGGAVSKKVVVGGSYLPIVGDFDGDGRDDILWYAPGVAPDGIWYGRADRGFDQTGATQDLIAGTPVVGDFDGDGRDDILWYGRGTASDAVWWSNGRTWLVKTVSVSNTYTVTALHDDATGRDYPVFVPTSGSGASRWSLSRNVLTSTPLDAAGLVGSPTVGDFDGNGFDDLLLLVPDGRSWLWFSSNAGVTARQVSTPPGASAASGRMEYLSPRDELLLVSATGNDELLRIGADQSITRTQVG